MFGWSWTVLAHEHFRKLPDKVEALTKSQKPPPNLASGLENHRPTCRLRLFSSEVRAGDLGRPQVEAGR